MIIIIRIIVIIIIIIAKQANVMLSVTDAVTLNWFLSTEIRCPQLSHILFPPVHPFFISQPFGGKMQLRDPFFLLNTGAHMCRQRSGYCHSRFIPSILGTRRDSHYALSDAPQASRAVTRGAKPSCSRPSSQQGRPKGSPISSYNAL